MSSKHTCHTNKEKALWLNMKPFSAWKQAIFGRVMHVTFFRNARHTALGHVMQKQNMLGLKVFLYYQFWYVIYWSWNFYENRTCQITEFATWSRLPSLLSLLCRNARHTCSWLHPDKTKKGRALKLVMV